MDESGSVVGTNKEMAEILNAFFLHPYLPMRMRIQISCLQSCSSFMVTEQDKLCDFNITPNTVKQKLCKLKNNKSPGVGSIDTKMLMGHLGTRHLEVSVPHCR